MGTFIKEINMFRTSVNRGIAFTAVVIVIVLTTIAYGWVESGQFTWKQVAQMYMAVSFIVVGFSAGIWWVSRGEGFYE